MKRTKYYFIFISIMYVLLYRDVLQRYIPLFKYIDEAIALMAVPIWILSLVKKQYVIKVNTTFKKRFIVMFIVTGILSSLLGGYQSLNACITDFLICIKFWLALYVGYSLVASDIFDVYGKDIAYHVNINTYIMALLAIISYLPYGMFRGEIRYGIKSLQIFFSLPTTLASSLVGLIAILVVTKKFNKFFYLTFSLLIIMMCLTLRSKAIATAIATVLIFYFSYIRKKKISMKSLLLLVPLFIAIAWDQIYFYFFSGIKSDSARYQLLLTSVKVANDHFPLGGGFATFGSATSGDYYSPLYNIYNISGVNGLREGSTYYVSDSFWPMVIGQFGWIGLALMACILISLFRVIQQHRVSSKAAYVGMVILYVYLLIMSSAESAYVHPNSIFLGFLMGGLLSCGKINNI